MLPWAISSVLSAQEIDIEFIAVPVASYLVAYIEIGGVNEPPI